MITPEEKNRLYMIRASLNKGEVQRPDDILWMLLKIDELQQDLQTAHALHSNMSQENIGLKRRMSQACDQVQKSVRDTFDQIIGPCSDGSDEYT